MSRWIALIEPYYPSGKRGRPTRGIELMLRMYLLQIWLNLSDEGVEDAHSIRAHRITQQLVI